MGSGETMELGRLLIDIPVKYRAVKELHIRDNANDYGCLSLTLLLADNADASAAERLEGQKVRILTPEGKAVFCGTCSGAGVMQANRYAELHLEAKGHAWAADQTLKTRTFQSPGKTLGQVAEAVLSEYGAGFMLERDVPIPWMLSQQNETDWQFLKRIANQCGLLLFADAKSASMQVSIGAAPFGEKSLFLENTYEEKDIAAYWSVKQNTKKDASAYEFLKTGGVTGDLTAGSGYQVAGGNAPQVITASEIRSERGMLYNHVLITYTDGAVPSMEEAFVGKAQTTQAQTAQGAGSASQSFTSVLTGEVLEVSGTDIKVRFDGDSGGVRWIPYTSALGNDIYCMPDEGDTVFC